MNTLLTDLIYPGILAILTAVLGYGCHLLKDSRKINNANAKGTMLLLRREIINDHYKFCTKGEPMQAFDFEDLTEIHDAYKALGGNGLTDKMYDELMALDLHNGE